MYIALYIAVADLEGVLGFRGTLGPFEKSQEIDILQLFTSIILYSLHKDDYYILAVPNMHDTHTGSGRGLKSFTTQFARKILEPPFRHCIGQ